MSAHDERRSFVPDDFVVPRELVTGEFRLEPLGPQHNERDYEAWTSSIEHIRATPGFADASWPPAEGMALEDNLRDLQEHAEDFANRTGFTYTVLDAGGDRVVGCVYIYPAKDAEGVANVHSWVRADRAELDVAVHDAVAFWLNEAWPFETVSYAPR